MCLIWADEIEDKKGSGADMSPVYLGRSISVAESFLLFLIIFTVLFAFTVLYCFYLFLLFFTVFIYFYCSLLFDLI